MKSATSEFIERLKNDFGFVVSENVTNEYLEKEKQDIIDTYIDGQSHGFNHYKDAEDYYNQVFKNK